MPRRAGPRRAVFLLFGRMRSRLALATLAALVPGCASMRGVTPGPATPREIRRRRHDPAARSTCHGTPRARELAYRRMGAPPPRPAVPPAGDRGEPGAWRVVPATPVRDPW